MSPLTKLFVVLLVILSLLTTAATVVFVNQVDNANVALAQAKTQRAAAEQAATDAQQAKAAADANAADATRQAQAQTEQSRLDQVKLAQHNNELNATNAELRTSLALNAADITRLTEALNASQQAGSKKDDIIVALRTTNDERLKQNVELNTEVTDLTNKLQVVTRDFKYVSEQLAESKSALDKQGAMLQENGINPKMAKTTAAGNGAPSINGVIRARRTIASMPYATISVGSNDGVAKGMEFKIVNRSTGDFLGILTVDAVEATESTGKLSGPRIGDIAPGVEVRTQL